MPDDWILTEIAGAVERQRFRRSDIEVSVKKRHAANRKSNLLIRMICSIIPDRL